MTKMKYWPGNNITGTILMDIRAELMNDEQTQKSTKKKKEKR